MITHTKCGKDIGANGTTLEGMVEGRRCEVGMSFGSVQEGLPVVQTMSGPVVAGFLKTGHGQSHGLGNVYPGEF